MCLNEVGEETNLKAPIYIGVPPHIEMADREAKNIEKHCSNLLFLGKRLHCFQKSRKTEHRLFFFSQILPGFAVETPFVIIFLSIVVSVTVVVIITEIVFFRCFFRQLLLEPLKLKVKKATYNIVKSFDRRELLLIRRTRLKLDRTCSSSLELSLVSSS